jgi:hypothetical protein
VVSSKDFKLGGSNLVRLQKGNFYPLHHDECDIDIKELFKELKKLGPTVLIEIYKEDETVNSRLGFNK